MAHRYHRTRALESSLCCDSVSYLRGQLSVRQETTVYLEMASNKQTSDAPLANLLFEFRGADLILRSHDAYHFRVPKSYIVNSSPVLEELIQKALNPPDAAHREATLPVVQLPESGAIIYKLLTFIFPVIPVSPSTTKETMKLLSVANKYKMASVLVHIRNSISNKEGRGPIYVQRDSTLLIYSLAQTYGLRPEALLAAEHLLMFSMDIEHMEDELDIVPGASLYELWGYHQRVRDILVSDLRKFRTSGALGTLTGLRCAESSSSNVPRWLDVYIRSIGENPQLFNLNEFTIALVCHVRDGARNDGCACASITSKTILKFWKALWSVYNVSLKKVCVADMTKLSVS